MFYLDLRASQFTPRMIIALMQKSCIFYYRVSHIWSLKILWRIHRKRLAGADYSETRKIFVI